MARHTLCLVLSIITTLATMVESANVAKLPKFCSDVFEAFGSGGAVHVVLPKYEETLLSEFHRLAETIKIQMFQNLSLDLDFGRGELILHQQDDKDLYDNLDMMNTGTWLVPKEERKRLFKENNTDLRLDSSVFLYRLEENGTIFLGEIFGIKVCEKLYA